MQRWMRHVSSLRIGRCSVLAGAFLAMIAQPAAGHAGDDPIDGPWWQAWSWDPLVLAGCALLAGVYAAGTGRLWNHAGWGRGIGRWQVGCFAAGIVVLLVALASPIETLSGHLAWVHMIQHTLLMLVAAPLLVAGSPAVAAAWALPPTWGRRAGRWRKRSGGGDASRYVLWQPLLLWTLFSFTLWVWHLPVLYDLALRNDLVHHAQHLAFAAGACLYWRVVLDPLGRVRLTPALAVAYLFTMSLQGMLLGVFMALSPRLWYEHYAQTTQAWGVSPITDQQLAGYIMWMPACGIYALIAAAILWRWLRRSVREDDHRAIQL